ncbi:MAG: 6,7-dimethyl-8-ribityllumazine synthase [Acidobacteriaceae bacterium]
MIKGITLVQPTGSAKAFERLKSLFDAIGFEAGRNWDEGGARGSAHLAPLGNIEFVEGRLPAVPPILIEVTQLDQVRETARKWLERSGETDAAQPAVSDIGLSEVRLPGVRISEIQETHWNSRLFTMEPRFHPEDAAVYGFWESNNVHHGRPVAVEGDLSAAGMRIAIVVARWNAVITDRLLQGSLDALYRSGAAKQDVRIVRVPGAWEVPAAARTLAESGDVDAVIALGVLLRGETAHYEAIYNEVARGIGQSQQDTGVPHAFGVLTCETLEQALDRAGLKAGNKGFEAAIAAIEMVSLTRKLRGAVGAPSQEPGDATRGHVPTQSPKGLA